MRESGRGREGMRMRIVAGRHKGRALVTPKGRSTRPTADRTREAVFNVLAHAAWAPALDGARVIDLFAGSGALGLEALSRGASFALFVESDAGARGAIRQNADALGVMGVTRIHRRDATALGEKPAGLGAPFDLAFLDPPYGKGLAPPALAKLAEGGWLAPDAVAVVEVGKDEPDPAVEGFALEDVRTYGEAKVAFLRCTA
jgi:16S rRNA (guanine966-N2)-methyltransferase